MRRWYGMYHHRYGMVWYHTIGQQHHKESIFFFFLFRHDLFDQSRTCGTENTNLNVSAFIRPRRSASFLTSLISYTVLTWWCSDTTTTIPPYQKQLPPQQRFVSLHRLAHFFDTPVARIAANTAPATTHQTVNNPQHK